MDYTTSRRLENELIEIARRHGYNGSPFLRDTPPLADKDAELRAIWLSLAVHPRPATQRQRDQLRQWARNVVLSSTEPEQPTVTPAKRRTVLW